MYSNQNIPLLNMKITSVTKGSSYDPDAFGPPFWFTIHNSATTYPVNPTPIIRDSMKCLLQNLPLLVPCVSCKEHFYTYLNSINLDNVVESKENLFSFTVNVHNYVNRRYKKPEMSLNDAKKLYGFNNPETGSSIRITYG
jgi:hypothetical protein